MLRSSNWIKGQDKQTWENAVNTGRRAWKHVDKTGFSEKVIQFMDTVYQKANFENVSEEMNKRPQTLVMGDCHAKNMFWNMEKDEIIITDFSEIGVGDPLSDIVQYIISDVETSVRREH